MKMAVASLIETLDLTKCYLCKIRGAVIHFLPVHWDWILDNR